MNTKIILTLPLALLLIGTAHGGGHEPEIRNCIDTQRISRTEIIDRSNIVFKMRGGDIYLNTLPRKCPGLRSFKAIGYKTVTGELCSVDTITVLDRTGGGLDAGARCGLGKFQPISEERLALLKSNDAMKVDPDAASPEIEDTEDAE